MHTKRHDFLPGRIASLPAGNFLIITKFLLIFTLLFSGFLNAQPIEDECSSSAANAEDYNAGDNIYIWSDGSNDGSGFGAWQLSTTDNDPARNGHFIGNSAANGNGDDNQDDDINKDGRSWGLYANQGNTASAIRPFTTPMVIGSSFSLKMDNGWVDENSGSKVGFSLQNSAGEDLVTFQYDGLAGHYQIINFGGTGNIDPEDIDFTDEGICIKITYADVELYDIEIIDIISGESYTPSREQFISTNGPQVPAQVRLFNMNAGGDSPRDIFFNCLELCPPPCEITDLEVVEQDVCNPESNTFTSLVRVTYANPPSTGNLIVYSRSFPILGSPQDVELSDLPAEGGSIDVTAYFSDEPECTYTEAGVIIAPASCSDLTCENSDATGTAYDDGWQSGDNDGSGFGPWALSTSSGEPARNGFFIGNSIYNGDGDGNSDGDINTNDLTWGLYANQGNTATATRPFAQVMTEGSCLSFKMDNGFVEPGGQVTATLLAAGGSLLDILFAGDASQFQIDPSFYHIFDDNGLSNTNLDFSDEGLEIKITVRAGNTYDLEIIRLEGGTATFSGRSFKSVSGNPAPIGIVFTNHNAGADPPRDLFVNSLEICHPIDGSSGHDLVLFAEEDVDISAAALVDGSIHANDDVDVNRGAPTIIDGNITAVDDIDISSDNTVNGDVLAGDDLDNDANVNGTASGNAAVDPIPLPALPPYSAGSDDVDVEDTDDLVLPPGSYRDVVVERDGVLRFSSGEYFLDELEFGTDTRLIVDASGGPVIVNIVSDLEFGQRMVVEISGGTSNSLTFNNLQSRRIDIGREATVLGNIIAPDANVRADSYVNFRGTICAEDIVFATGAAILGHGSAQSFPKVRTNGEDGEALAALADDYELLQNYPNPFNPSTTIGFRISDAGIVTLKIYDISGRLVKTLLNENRNAGNYSVTWDGTNQSGVKVGSGIYLYKLTAGNFQQVKKMMLIK